MKILLTIFTALLSVTASSSLIIDAEARGADEPCSYLHPSWSINPNTGICESNIRHSSSSSSSSGVKQLDNVGSNAIIAAMERQKAAQAAQTGQFGSLQINCGQGTVLNGNLCVIDQNTLNAAYATFHNNVLSTNYLFDNVYDFTVVCSSLSISLISIGIYIQFFSRKKRIERRNRKLSKKLIQRQPNPLVVTPAEHRRIQEFEANFITVGKSDPEYFLHVTSGAELIDASRRGNELYSIDTIIPGRTLKILKYRDPSTDQLYISFVPDDLEKADDAMAWKFQINPGDYGGLAGSEA